MKTDKQLRADVIAELDWDPSVHATQIGVEVTDGVVTLAGHVGTYAEKWNAEAAVQRVSGVKALAVEIEIKLSGLGERDDGDIAASASNMLAWAGSVPDGAVHVKVEGGWITLGGSVDWQYQRQAAVEAVRFLAGVKGVSDQIAVKPRATLGVLKADIEAALKRQASRDAGDIAVNVDAGQVTLTGVVHSFGERQSAVNAAWAAPGAHSVVDAMTFSD